MNADCAERNGGAIYDAGAGSSGVRALVRLPEAPRGDMGAALEWLAGYGERLNATPDDAPSQNPTPLSPLFLKRSTDRI
jgi:hypothetical protein